MGEISKFYGGMDVSKGRVVALIPANDAGIVSSTQLIVSPQPDYKIYGNLETMGSGLDSLNKAFESSSQVLTPYIL